MESDIERALAGHLAGLVATGIRIAWQNKPFAPGSGEYLRASLAFIPPQRLTLDASHRLRGWLQVDVMTPEGAGTNMARVQQVIALFPADLTLTEGATALRITERAGIGPLIKGTPHWQQPVTVRFEAATGR